MLDLHKAYGPVVRVSPSQLAFFTAQSFRDIYGRTGPRSFKKDPLSYQGPLAGVDHLVSCLDDSEHARQRRLMAQGFSGEALKAQEPIVQRYVDALIRRVEVEAETSTKGVDISYWINSTTFDLTGDLTFGENFGCLETSEMNPWIEKIFGAVKAVVIMLVVKAFPLLDWALMKCIPKSVLQEGIDHFNYSAERAERYAMPLAHLTSRKACANEI
jgi:cytochrome P450